MHPGHILVRLNRTSVRVPFPEPRPHVVFLDVGMTAELSKKDQRNLLSFFKALVLRDGCVPAEYTLRLSKRQNVPDLGAFIAGCFFMETRLMMTAEHYCRLV